jgi:alpha-D-ribose 1-methylphosphonate 5-triphosphate synthase subunit PhnG
MTAPSDDRAAWMSVLSCARRADLEPYWHGFADQAQFTWLKKPEFGAVLVRGRINGRDAEFNVGELTLTRCSLQLGDGPVGVGYVAGCDKRHATMAAVFDALLQVADARGTRARGVINELRAALATRRSAVAEKTEASRVDFTMAMRD